MRSENVGPAKFRALVNEFGGAEAAIAAVPMLSRRGEPAHDIRLCTEAEAEANSSGPKARGKAHCPLGLHCLLEAGRVPANSVLACFRADWSPAPPRNAGFGCGGSSKDTKSHNTTKPKIVVTSVHPYKLFNLG